MPPDRNNVTWKWLVGVLLSLLLLVGGMVIADNRVVVMKNQDKIEEIKKDKVDKEQYYRDIADIKNTLDKIDLKVDKIREKMK